jgi:hypothetical protein
MVPVRGIAPVDRGRIAPGTAAACGDSAVTIGVPQRTQNFHDGAISIEHETQAGIVECYSGPTLML